MSGLSLVNSVLGWDHKTLIPESDNKEKLIKNREESWHGQNMRTKYVYHARESL